MQRPPVEHATSYESVTVETDLPVSLGAFSRWFTEIGASGFGSFMTGTSAVPGVVHSELLNGSWSKPGDRRRVVFADGNSSLEEIIMERRPHVFRYEVWNLTNDTGRYITYALSEFEFSDSKQGTHIRWTYSFQPKLWPDGLFIQSFVRGDFRQFLGIALETMKMKASADLVRK